MIFNMSKQIRVNDDMSHINTARQDPMLNLQITLPNDLYTPPAGLVSHNIFIIHSYIRITSMNFYKYKTKKNYNKTKIGMLRKQKKKSNIDI